MDQTTRLAIGSILVGIAVLGLKTLAWALTGSVALFSDALESIVNVATAVAALVAVRISARPADAGHPFGHHKVEFFAAVLEGALIIVAALVILHEAWGAVMTPRVIAAPYQGLAVNALAGVINAVWCHVLISRGRRLRSPALVADGRHLLSDVLSSAGVTAGVLLAIATGTPWLDPALAALVALNILWSGWRVMRDSLGGLMDSAVDDDTLARIREVISLAGEGAVEAHDLRTRHAGRATFIEFHLVVPGAMTVAEAHRICDRIEEALEARIPGARVLIHVEPEEKAKQSGIVVL
ncbi:MAG: cadmium transporter [Paracoccaceae bacterium]|nr:MAG: cation transporter [Alphaproteobacteria bacterium]GIX14800.1 MAG: cadmium transporter [Paracoccaceae bacterium]